MNRKEKHEIVIVEKNIPVSLLPGVLLGGFLVHLQLREKILIIALLPRLSWKHHQWFLYVFFLLIAKKYLQVLLGCCTKSLEESSIETWWVLYPQWKRLTTAPITVYIGTEQTCTYSCPYPFPYNCTTIFNVIGVLVLGKTRRWPNSIDKFLIISLDYFDLRLVVNVYDDIYDFLHINILLQWFNGSRLVL